MRGSGGIAIKVIGRETSSIEIFRPPPPHTHTLEAKGVKKDSVKRHSHKIFPYVLHLYLLPGQFMNGIKVFLSDLSELWEETCFAV